MIVSYASVCLEVDDLVLCCTALFQHKCVVRRVDSCAVKRAVWWCVVRPRFGLEVWEVLDVHHRSLAYPPPLPHLFGVCRDPYA